MSKKDAIEITESSGNVFADIGVAEPEKYLAKAKLAQKINSIIDKRGLKQKAAAEVLEITQPKVSLLKCGRLEDFSIEKLISFLNKLDRDVEIRVKEKPTRRKTHGHLKVAFS